MCVPDRLRLALYRSVVQCGVACYCMCVRGVVWQCGTVRYGTVLEWMNGVWWSGVEWIVSE